MVNQILCIIDLIEDYFDARKWPSSVIPAARARLCRSTNELVVACRARRIPIVWVRQEFATDFSDAFLHAREIGTEYALAGSQGAALLAELDVQSGDHVMAKRRFSAFHGTNLDRYLADQEVSEIILAGITTAWCVRSTAIRVLLASDCLAAFTQEAHDESVAAMDGYIGKAMSNDDLVSALDRLSIH